MTTDTEIRLLTLLNVSAVKRPRGGDLPGGQRGSPSRGLSPLASSSAPPPIGTRNGHAVLEGHESEEVEAGLKKRKRVSFGGKVGPSGSTFKKNKGKSKEVSANARGNGVKGSRANVFVEEEVDDEGKRSLQELAGGDESDDNAADTYTGRPDTFNSQFAADNALISPERLASADQNDWTSSRCFLKGYGKAVLMTPGSSTMEEANTAQNRLVPSLVQSLKRAKTDLSLVTSALSHMGTYRDLFIHGLDGEADGSEKGLNGSAKEAMRQAAMTHAMNHILKTGRRITRNNEKLAHAAASENVDPLPPPQDSSFTRPKVLVLVPLRSLALHLLTENLFPLAPPGTQIENLRPFTSSFSIPEGAGNDPLASSSAASQFPIDHIVNFKGNSDDNFRFGIKVTRKAWRIVMPPVDEERLLDCDFIVASPLGLRTAAEKEDSTDTLSSIEVLLADGLDVMAMQNWEHVQFIFKHLNEIPQDTHGCDISRLKPWYTDGSAKYLRQNILFSRFETPESRALFHRQCHNLAGKVRLEQVNCEGVLSRVRIGVKQVFERVDMDGGKGMSGDAAIEEVEQRLNWFVKKTIPALLKSAISREHTLIVIPSYFDFVRVVSALRKVEKLSFEAISEYSSNAEISRARTLFFKGKKQFLLVTERFHFYRRYKIRGAKSLVFFALPDHAHFYSEFLETPFLASRSKEGQEVEVDVDEAEISARTLFSRFDVLRLERIVGSENARRMLHSGEGRFEFV